MCDPVTIATIGLSIGQSVMSYSAASAQADAQTEMARQNAINASKATETQYANLNTRAMQEDLAANQQRQEIALKERKASATIQTAAGEAGISGLAVDHVLQDLYAQGGRALSTIDTNQSMSRAYLQGEKRAATAGGQNQINSVPAGEQPSFAPYLVDIFSSGIGAYADHKKSQILAGRTASGLSI